MELQLIRHSDGSSVTLTRIDEEGCIRYVRTGSDETFAVLNYLIRDNTMIMLHTEVDEELQGQGMAKRLVQDGLFLAKEKGLKIQATCSYVRGYFERNPDPDYQSVFPEIR